MAFGSVAAGDAYVRIVLMDQTEPGLQKVEKRIQSMNRRLAQTGQKLASMGSMVAASFGSALLAPMKGILEYAEYNRVLQATQAKGQLTGANLQKLEKMQREYAKGSSWEPTQVGRAGLIAAGMGVSNVEDNFAVTRSALDAARVMELEDPELATRTILSTTRAFGMSLETGTEQIADKMAAAVNNAGMFFDDMQMIAMYASSNAGTLKNQSFDDLAAVGMILTDKGFRGSSLGTSMRRFFTSIGVFADQLEKLGIDVVDEEGTLLGVRQILRNFSEYTKDLSEVDRIKFVKKFFGQYASSQMLAVFSEDPAMIDARYSMLADSKGYAAETRAQMESGLWGTLKKISSAWQELWLTVGASLSQGVQAFSVPLIAMTNWLAQIIQQNAHWVRLLTVTIGFIAGIGSVLAAVGAVTMSLSMVNYIIYRGVLGICKLLKLIPFLLGTIGSVLAGVLQSVLMFLSLPVPLMLALSAAIALVGALAYSTLAGTQLMTTLNDGGAAFLALISNGKIEEAFGIAAKSSSIAWKDFFFNLKSAWLRVGAWIATKWEALMGGIYRAMMTASLKAMEVLKKGTEFFGGDGSSFDEAIARTKEALEAAAPSGKTTSELVNESLKAEQDVLRKEIDAHNAAMRAITERENVAAVPADARVLSKTGIAALSPTNTAGKMAEALKEQAKVSNIILKATKAGTAEMRQRAADNRANAFGRQNEQMIQLLEDIRDNTATPDDEKIGAIEEE